MLDELTLKNSQPVRINNDLDNFMYTASHDLEAPIFNIEGLLRVLLKGLPADIRQEERTQKVSGLIGDSVERFKRTITHLTDVVKLQKESSQELEQVDLREVIEEVRQDLAPQVQLQCQ